MKKNLPENNAGLTAEEQRLRAEQKKRAQKKKRKKAVRTAIIILLILAVLGVIVLQFFKIKKAEKVASNLTTYTVSRRDIEVALSATGTLMPVDSYTITASVKGDILECNFEEGDEVQKDDVLYRIDSSVMDKTLRQREMSLDEARDSYNDLVADRKKLNTYSEYAGTVTKLYIEAGDTVREDQAIADVVDKKTMLIDLPFFVQDADGMFVGETVLVKIDGTGEEISGSVTEISPLVEVNAMGARTRDVTVSVQNPGSITNTTTATGSISADITSTDSGRFEYSVEEQILASYSGDVQRLYIAEGSEVAPGTLVLTIDGKDLEKSIKRSANSLENAQISYDNTVDNIDDYTITAPISGTVVEKGYNAGESIDVTGGSKVVAIIYDLSAYTMDINIDELDIRSIEKGQEVAITSDAYEGRDFVGRITKISKVGSTSGGTTVYPVTVTIDDESALETLLPGMNVDAEIIISRSENVLAVPTGAIARGNTVRRVVDPEALRAANEAEMAKSAEKNGAKNNAKNGAAGGNNSNNDKKTNTEAASDGAPSGFTRPEGTNTEAATDGAPSGFTRPDGTSTEAATDGASSGFTRPEGTSTEATADGAPSGFTRPDGTNTEATADGASSGFTRPAGGNAGAWGGFGGTRNQAVYGTAPAETETETIRVTTGVSDDDYIEIVDGLNEGDIVIVEASQVPSSNPFAAMMNMGGGMGGMGGMSGGMGGGNRNFGGGQSAGRAGGMGGMR